METETGKHWKRILNEIYKFYPHLWGESSKKKSYEDDHPLAKKLRISGKELMLGLMFLEDNKLVTTNTNNSVVDNRIYSTQYILTGKGFEVAIENEKAKNQFRLMESQRKINKVLSNATIVIAMGAFLNIIFYIFSENFSVKISSDGSSSLSFFILVVGFGTGVMVKFIFEAILPKNFWRNH